MLMSMLMGWYYQFAPAFRCDDVSTRLSSFYSYMVGYNTPGRESCEREAVAVRHAVRDVLCALQWCEGEGCRRCRDGVWVWIVTIMRRMQYNAMLLRSGQESAGVEDDVGVVGIEQSVVSSSKVVLLMLREARCLPSRASYMSFTFLDI